MATEQLGIEQENLNRYVKISVLLHVGIFLLFTVKAVFFMDTPIQFENAIRVDMVGLPDKVAELPPMEASAPPTTLPAPTPVEPEPKAVTPPAEKPKLPPKPKEDAISLEKTKSKQKSAMEKLKQMEALEAIQKEMDREKAKAAAAEAAKKYKGNVLAAGTALTGVNKLQVDQYVGTVHQHMIDHWVLPEYMKNRNFRTDVLVRFDEAGNILEKTIVKSSGNQGFDDLVLSAIQKSSPVPAPPGKFTKIASVEGFLFRFSHN